MKPKERKGILEIMIWVRGKKEVTISALACFLCNCMLLGILLLSLAQNPA